MAPLTRTRADNPGHVPTSLMREYYEQRATAGLIISEGTWVSETGQGWHGAPGLYNREQSEAWRNITDAVHAKGGLIFAQLWHQGSISLAEFFNDGRRPLAPSAVNPLQMVHTAEGQKISEVPQEMTMGDIHQAIDDFRKSAQYAKDAGFDGIQLQAGYIYLIMQFLHETTNQRTDRYGGSIENRARFLFEVLDAVLTVWPGERVSLKTGPMLSEYGNFKAVPSTIKTLEYVYAKLNKYNLSHLLLMRQLADLTDTPIVELQGDEVLHHARKHYFGKIILNVGVEPKQAEDLIAGNEADAIAFGREFIANPDLVERLLTGASLNPQRPEGYYGSSAEGYTDYPFLTNKETFQIQN